MSKWSYVFAGAVFLAAVSQVAGSDAAPRRSSGGLAFHVRTAHCQLAGAILPVRMKLVCA
jgi:hypothetical protein